MRAYELPRLSGGRCAGGLQMRAWRTCRRLMHSEVGSLGERVKDAYLPDACADVSVLAASGSRRPADGVCHRVTDAAYCTTVVFARGLRARAN